MEQRTIHGPCEKCLQQIADAEREMGAFVAAVGRHSGPVAAVSAAEHWIELSESISPTSVDGRPNWRELTIMASCRLATDNRLNGRTAQDAEGRCQVK
jgi:hypothetical protein